MLTADDGAEPRIWYLRYFVLQLIPSLTSIYLSAVANKKKKSVALIETLFLAIYNEEILAGGAMCDNMSKKVEEIRIPSVRYPSIYHDPAKMHTYPEIGQLKYGHGTNGVQSTVRIGPFPSVDEITAENRFLVLARLLKSVNNSLCHLSLDVICRSLCLSILTICHSGFNFSSDEEFRVKVLDTSLSDEQEVYGDFVKKHRIPISAHFLLEAINGVYFSIFNGYADVAIRALDALHQRAQYEMLPDVLLVTNAMRSSLMENSILRERKDEFIRKPLIEGSLTRELRREPVTNASLRIKKLEEDIPVVATPEEETKISLFDSVEGLKKKMAALKHEHLHGHHKKSPKLTNEDKLQDKELSVIAEEGSRMVLKKITAEYSVESLENGNETVEVHIRQPRGSVSGPVKIRHMDSADSS
ncbi:hypothetical protein L596_014166 [Steinernema carpocapsae]|uniref:Hyccin n=1 Tax=Steinernema carpocapsae TaxID=34508 RepID=A0A4U5NBX6_STECR|nr:hypothetical protein L596_014166 [Steinernema carpocapsae]